MRQAPAPRCYSNDAGDWFMNRPSYENNGPGRLSRKVDSNIVPGVIRKLPQTDPLIVRAQSVRTYVHSTVSKAVDARDIT